MASSSRQLESKDPIEVMAPSLVGPTASAHIPTGVTELIFEYVDGADINEAKQPVWLKQPATLHTFFGISSSQKLILSCAEYAGPLNQMEAYVRQDHDRSKHPDLPLKLKKAIEQQTKATLKEAINRATIGLDQTIRDESGAEIDKGMAERLFELYDELYCRHLDPICRETELETIRAQARFAAPLEDKKEKQKREEMNFAAINQVFNAIKNHDTNTLAAIENFKVFVKSTKPEVIRTNQYYLNLLHLAFAAFDVLARRGGELPKIEEKDYGQWYGKLADQFCFKIIGDAIEKELSPRMRQLLRGGLYYILNRERSVMRDLDVSGVAFCGSTSSTSRELGVNSYYDDMAGVGYLIRRESDGWRQFQNLLEQLRQHPKFITPQPHTHSACPRV